MAELSASSQSAIMRLSAIISSALAPALASALTLNLPSSLKYGAPTNISWVNGPNDYPYWNLFLTTNNPFDLRQYIAANVDPSLGYITTTFPVDRVKVGETYVIRAVNASFVDAVIAFSPLFSLTN